MTTLVTGATGLVGNNVARMLLEQGQPVRVLVRAGCDSRPLEGLGVESVQGDVRDADSVQRAMSGVKCVVHAAAQIHIGWTGLESQRAVNVEGTRNVAAAALQAGARMVHVSSVDTLGIGSKVQSADEDTPREGNTLCTYVVTKREAEATVLEYAKRGLDAVIVNPGFMLGPWDWKPSSGRMLLDVAKRFTPLAPSGGCSTCDVRDVAAGILAASERGQSGRQYILGGHNLSYLDLWKLFARFTNSGAPLGSIGPLVGFVAGRFGDLAGWLLRREGDVNSAALHMSSLFHYYNSSRAVSELGYSNRPLEETVSDAWRWFGEWGYVRGARRTA